MNAVQWPPILLAHQQQRRKALYPRPQGQKCESQAGAAAWVGQGPYREVTAAHHHQTSTAIGTGTATSILAGAIGIGGPGVTRGGS